MNTKETKTSSSGIGFFGVLQIVFIVLKLVKVIDWSWGWVLAPLWIEGIFVVVILGIVWLIEKWTRTL